MKKLLLILAAIAYIAISCEDKPNTLTGGDEPEVDTSADTCSIYVHRELPYNPIVAMIYQTSSENVDFDASVTSIFKHYTITLKDGTYDTAIGHNCTFHHTSTFDSGYVESVADNTRGGGRSLKYGKYLVVIWNAFPNGIMQWGPDYYDTTQRFLYRNITLDDTHPHASIIFEEKLNYLMKTSTPLHFREF